MSVNWVMLSTTSSSSTPFTPLNNERVLFKSPPRVALSITAPHVASGQKPSFTPLHSASGILYLTNRRIVFLPETPSETVQSFSTPILNLHDTHVTAPFFGPNAIIALLQPVAGGGIPSPSGGVVELKLTFKDGGAFDFQSHFERVKERLQQAIEVSRISGTGATPTRASLAGVDVSGIDLEELPAYQEQSDRPLLSPVVAAQQALNRDREAIPPNVMAGSASQPLDPPPGYEEAQIQSLQDEARRQSHDADGGDDVEAHGLTFRTG